MLKAKTMVELKAKIRKALGWSDRRSWTEAERLEVKRRYSITADFTYGGFIAVPTKLAI